MPTFDSTYNVKWVDAGILLYLPEPGASEIVLINEV